MKCNDKTFTNPNQICEVFNELFASIGPKLAEEIPTNVTGHSRHLDYLTIQNHEHSFQFQETNTSAVFSLLSKLYKSKATGLDRISAKLLRVCPDLIAESLCAIFNRSINTGIFPTDWKCSKVIPLFKKGERRDLNNYHPISIIPVVAKVFERIILGFHMTSRPPCWCPQTMKWRPCWCPDPILWALKAIIMLTSSFVFVEKHGC